MRLKRINVQHFRRVKPGTSIQFDGASNLVLGKNGTGKTSLLELLSMFSVGHFAPLEREQFDVTYFLTYDDTPCSFRVAAKPTEQGAGAWEYEFTVDAEDLTLSCDGDGGILRKGTQTSTVTSQSPFAPGFWVRALTPLPKRWGRMSQRQNTLRIDEGLACYRSLVGQEAPSTSWGLAWQASRCLVSKDGTRTKSNPLEHNLSELVIGEPDRAPQWLERARRLLGYDKASYSLREMASGNGESLQGELSLRFERNGDSVTDRVMSYGQKRLLAILYTINETTDFVIADELVNGLHHDWIEACLEAFGDKQAFLSSQNPLLMDHLVFTDPEQVERAFVFCSDEDGSWQWRNPTPREAGHFFAAYERGIQHVSGILRTQGLW